MTYDDKFVAMQNNTIRNLREEVAELKILKGNCDKWEEHYERTNT